MWGRRYFSTFGLYRRWRRYSAKELSASLNLRHGRRSNLVNVGRDRFASDPHLLAVNEIPRLLECKSAHHHTLLRGNLMDSIDLSGCV